MITTHHTSQPFQHHKLDDAGCISARWTKPPPPLPPPLIEQPPKEIRRHIAHTLLVALPFSVHHAVVRSWLCKYWIKSVIHDKARFYLQACRSTWITDWMFVDLIMCICVNVLSCSLVFIFCGQYWKNWEEPEYEALRIRVRHACTVQIHCTCTYVSCFPIWVDLRRVPERWKRRRGQT